MSALRIVLLGEEGEERRATGNTILGRAAFKDGVCSESLTRQCEKHEGTVDGRKISVITTPGLSDTLTSRLELKAGLEHCVSLSSPGPHVFLLVIRDGRFTGDRRNIIKWIQENFGEEALKFTMVLFTGGLQPVEGYLNKHTGLRKLVSKCRAGYHVFKNDGKHGRVQVTELLEKIDRMVQQNGGHYSNEMYRRKVREEKKKRRESEREEKAELIIRKLGRICVKLLEVILKALFVEIWAIFRSTLKGFGVGVIVIVALSLIGILTESWTCFGLKVLIFGSGGIMGAIIGLCSDTKINR